MCPPSTSMPARSSPATGRGRISLSCRHSRRYSAGKMSREDFEGIERHAIPGFGVCGAQYTANTMATAAAAMGLSLLNSPLIAAEDQEQLDSLDEAARALVRAIEMDLKPRDIVTRKSIANAIALVMATGGTTNAV